MRLSDKGEFQLIDQWANILPPYSSKVLLGIGDDAACLADLKSPVFSCDALIENVHFRREWISPRQLGWKSMAVNVSDMAAMGAAPVAAAITVALPPERKTAWVEELYRGFADAAERLGFSIVGGDTTKSAQAMISVAMIGELITQNALRRDGAKPEDVLLVTGTLGDSAAGLAALQANLQAQTAFQKRCIEKHLYPQPRVAEIRSALKVGNAVHAAIDISDGIAGDAAHIARKSTLDMVIESSEIPLSTHCRQTAASLDAELLPLALAGGEDYELLLCVDPAGADDIISQIQSETQTPVHRIGYCRAPAGEEPKVLLLNKGNPVAIPRSWQHF